MEEGMKRGLIILGLLLSMVVMADEYKLTPSMKLDQYMLMVKKLDCRKKLYEVNGLSSKSSSTKITKK